jgi:hypothetical protein
MGCFLFLIMFVTIKYCHTGLKYFVTLGLYLMAEPYGTFELTTMIWSSIIICGINLGSKEQFGMFC